MQLIIGNKNYSSWSLRAWLYLTEADVAFEEKRIPLFSGEGWRDEVLQYNPSGRVPALVDGDVRVWDSWAIMEYVRPKAQFDWPSDPAARGYALSVAAEMHAGFLGVRAEMPMNVRARVPGRWDVLSDETRAEVDRIRSIWTTCLERYGGPFLFGELSIADIMYAPVVTRFDTYDIELTEPLRRYGEAIHALGGMHAWCEAARDESERIDFVDALATDTPLNPG